jgi:hypothetical protein
VNGIGCDRTRGDRRRWRAQRRSRHGLTDPTGERARRSLCYSTRPLTGRNNILTAALPLLFNTRITRAAGAPLISVSLAYDPEGSSLLRSSLQSPARHQRLQRVTHSSRRAVIQGRFLLLLSKR